MKFEARPYQEEAVDAWWADIQNPQNNPVIAIPTGAGKSVIMGMFIKRYLDTFPDNTVLVLSHTQSILEQDHEALQEFFPKEHIGIYSAGLGLKEVEQITVGGIQSVAKAVDKFKWFNLILVDEVHSVNHKATGTYRKLLDTSLATKVGMSATVFRSGHGYIYKGKGTLFNKLSYDLTSAGKFNRLVKDGYLCKLISVAPDTQLDSSHVKKSGGDYNIKGLSKAHDKASITKAAVKEAIKYGKNYNKWLVFAIDIEHADHICRELNLSGVKSRVLHSRMSSDRESVINSFKNGDVQALVSVGMITTGFDSPHINLILMLRPTMSAVLHVQMVGRGLRTFPGKKHCLVLDFAGNTSRLGPINNVIVPKEAGSDGKGEAPTKTCPRCNTITFAMAKYCDSCGHTFVFESKLTVHSSLNPIVDETGMNSHTKWLNVKSVSYTLHQKAGAPDSVLVTYMCGVSRVQEWWCLNHTGYAGRKAMHMVLYRGYKGLINTHSVLANKSTLRVPTRILVDFEPKYPVILNSTFSKEQ